MVVVMPDGARFPAYYAGSVTSFTTGACVRACVRAGVLSLSLFLVLCSLIVAPPVTRLTHSAGAVLVQSENQSLHKLFSLVSCSRQASLVTCCLILRMYCMSWPPTLRVLAFSLLSGIARKDHGHHCGERSYDRGPRQYPVLLGIVSCFFCTSSSYFFVPCFSLCFSVSFFVPHPQAKLCSARPWTSRWRTER